MKRKDMMMVDIDAYYRERPRMTIVVTRQQAKRMNTLIPQGMKNRLIGLAIDRMLDQLEKDREGSTLANMIRESEGGPVYGNGGPTEKHN